MSLDTVQLSVSFIQVLTSELQLRTMVPATFRIRMTTLRSCRLL